MAAIARDLGLFWSCIFAELAAVFFASRRHTNTGLMTTLVVLGIAHRQTPSNRYRSRCGIGFKSGECCRCTRVSLQRRASGDRASVAGCNGIAQSQALNFVPAVMGRISAAARLPLAMAPCTVPLRPPMSVASPAKNNVLSIGRPSASSMPSPPTFP